MVPIKIECECGQRYAFEVQPINGKMPFAVTCPCCGADGTAAANESILKQLFPAAVVLPSVMQPMQNEGPEIWVEPLAQPGNSMMAKRRDPRLGLVNRDQAEHEARAKVMWGDSRDQVVSYLMIQGFSHPEAIEMTDNLLQERSSSIRSNGIGKVIKGAGLIALSVIGTIYLLSTGVVSTKVVGVAVITGLYGAYLLIRGLVLAVAPKSERGDMTKQ